MSERLDRPAVWAWGRVMVGIVANLFNLGVGTGVSPASPAGFANIMKTFTAPAPTTPAGPLPPVPRDVAARGAEYVRLAIGAYGVDVGLKPGWRREQLAALDGVPLHDGRTGFDAEIYVNDQTGEHVVAYRGSDAALGLQDWRTDFYAAADSQNVSEQNRQAIALGRAAKARYGDRLAFTGTSLGGIHAMTAGLATGTKAYTFTNVGVNDGVVALIGKDNVARNAGLITNFHLDGDLSDINRRHDGTSTGLLFGSNHYLPADRIGLPTEGLPAPLRAIAHEIPIFQMNELDRIATGRADGPTGLAAIAAFVPGYVGASTFAALRPADGGTFQTRPAQPAVSLSAETLKAIQSFKVQPFTPFGSQPWGR